MSNTSRKEVINTQESAAQARIYAVASYTTKLDAIYGADPEVNAPIQVAYRKLPRVPLTNNADLTSVPAEPAPVDQTFLAKARKLVDDARGQ